MTTVTIPKELTARKDLIAVPRETYREFLLWQKNASQRKHLVHRWQTKKHSHADEKTLQKATIFPLTNYDMDGFRWKWRNGDGRFSLEMGNGEMGISTINF